MISVVGLRKFFGCALAVVGLLFAYSNCMRGGFQLPRGKFEALSKDPDGTPDPGPTPLSFVGMNTLPINVGSCGKKNQACVSVAVCMPGTANCQTINNVLLDTGSTGLRIFQSSLSLTLPRSEFNGKTVAVCASYNGRTTQWGPVATADVVLGLEKAFGVPVQIIDTTFGAIPSDCQNNDASASSAGFNGILGVSVLRDDCGPNCAMVVDNRIYFLCENATCSPGAVPTSLQVANPVALMPFDNNGVIVKLDNVSDSGAAGASGTLTLGIGTQTNNSPPSAGRTVLEADEFGTVMTSFNGTSYTTFFDSGIDSVRFPRPASLSSCTYQSTEYYCLSGGPLSFTATVSGGPGSATVNFKVMSAATVFGGSSRAYNDLAGAATNEFHWGLPFFYGRTIYFGFSGRTSSLGAHPLFAY